MPFKTYAPSIALQPFVEEYFVFESYTDQKDSSVKTIPPNGLSTLLFQFADLESICYERLETDGHHPHRTAIVGQLTRHHYIKHIGKVGVLGVHFRPSGLYQILRVPVWRFTDKSTDMNILIKDGIKEITEKLIAAVNNDERILLIENFLLSRLSIIDISLGLLDRCLMKKDNVNWLSIAELAVQLKMTKKQLQRKFKEEIGISPNAYKKLIRFNQLVNALEFKLPKEWQQLTFESGYFDQAHMIREFKQFTGKAPANFIKHEKKFSFRPFKTE
jgi:AraC-like DNA-binding protein